MIPETNTAKPVTKTEPAEDDEESSLAEQLTTDMGRMAEGGVNIGSLTPGKTGGANLA